MLIEDYRHLNLPKVERETILKLALLVSTRFNVSVSSVRISYFSTNVGSFQSFILPYEDLYFKLKSANQASINPFQKSLQNPEITETYLLPYL